ncbi:uncharacterized protein DUF2726 [Sphaerotilus hippei]|uniref:Uncharacterized protein DUF2726 n=1 Tax=Sphaerotilus hippei TaxID=744406 RepID=A0A318H1K4_9BURK|nr:DUF2726 domain-containing protein [Sphaerotilus hippei]PXW96974.1 uncharacterized protein DUF2726 [Sphaerotilus hippei]
MTTHVWITLALAAAVLAGFATLLLKKPPRPRGSEALPEEWPLVQRPIFTPEERALYRQLRAALPHHTVLAKLPLVRICQPSDRETLRYWFNLLGPIHVSFVVCSDNGRILAAIDIERPSRPSTPRVATIKQSVLEACRIRYVTCRSDQLPSAAELQMLVPSVGDNLRPVVPDMLRDLKAPHSTVAQAARSRYAAESQWYDSGFAQDSFFSPETLRDPFREPPASGERPDLKVVSRPKEEDSAQARPDPYGLWAGRPSEPFGASGDAAGNIIGRH